MEKNKKFYTLFDCVLREDKKEFVWKHVVLRKLALALGIIVLFGASFDRSYLLSRPFWTAAVVQVVALIGLTILQGNLSYTLYKEMTEVREWTKPLKGRYIFVEGVLGWGAYCGLLMIGMYDITVVGSMLPIGINLLVFLLAGLAFGGIMCKMWNFQEIGKICLELKRVHRKW